MELLLQSNRRAVVFLHTVAIACSIITMVLGLLCLIFWQFNISPFSNLPYVSGMNQLSAVAFISAGGALLFLLESRDKTDITWQSIIAFILSCITIGIGTVFATSRFTTNKISSDIGISFLLIGIALLLLQFYYKKYFTRIAQLLTLIAAITSMFAIIGYAYKALSFYDTVSLSPMPLTSALTLAVLCLAILSARPNHGLTKILTRNTASSKMALRLILISLTLPAIIGSLTFIGKDIHLFDDQTVLALVVIGNIILFSITIWITTNAFQNVELENLIIKNELQKKNIELEVDASKLASKAMELEEEYKEVEDKLENRDKLFDALESHETD